MFKKVLSTTVLAVSVLGVMSANAAAPGVYVTGQLGYADTHMGSKLSKDLSNNGLAGRVALGYQFNQNFAVEAGYLQLSESKVSRAIQIPKVGLTQAALKLQQNVIDIVGKGIIPLSNNVNVYGKLGVAYINTNFKGTAQTPGLPTVTVDFNDTANIAKHKWAPEAAVGVSYDITPNVSLDTSLTHIQPLGSNKPGNIDFVAVGLSYNFG
jgi:OmpA-OmpF porin, OOP family